MADSSINIQATSATPATPIGVRTFDAIDPATGQVVKLQGVVLVSDTNQAILPLSEETGRNILAAIRQLHQWCCEQVGGLPPRDI